MALMASVTFTPAANFNGGFSIAASVSDGVAPAITGINAFTGIAVNYSPTSSDLSAALRSFPTRRSSDLDIVVSDIDSASVTATLTLSNVAAGSLSTATSGAVTSTYNADTGERGRASCRERVKAVLAAVSFRTTRDVNRWLALYTTDIHGLA